MKKEEVSKTLKNIIFFIVIILITYWIIFRKENLHEIKSIIQNANHNYLLVCIFLMCTYFLIESFNIKRLLSKLGEKVSIFRTYKYTLICFFFNGVTPAASGGQPMEIYNMNKDGIPGSKATLVLLMQMCSFKIATVTIGIISFLFNYRYLDTKFLGLFVIGIITYCVPLFIIMICIFFTKVAKRLVSFFVKILRRIGFKKLDDKKQKIDHTMEQYSESATFIKKNIGVFFASIFRVFIQLMCFYLITFFVYKALHLSGHTLLEIFTRQSLLYLMASWVPLPGAIGANEAIYLSLFLPIFGEDLLSSALLLSRGIDFYLFVLIGMIVVLLNRLLRGKRKEIGND